VLGLMIWLHRDQMIAKICEQLDEIADDEEALSQAQREEMSAQISGDMLATERLETDCIWHADAKGDVLDFRADTSPLAVLGLSLRTATPSDPSPGSSRSHAYDLVGLQRR